LKSGIVEQSTCGFDLRERVFREKFAAARRRIEFSKERSEQRKQILHFATNSAKKFFADRSRRNFNPIRHFLHALLTQPTGSAKELKTPL
jgi:hypothetical protein